MSELLEELRAERALIQKHLNWLDAQIVKVEDAVGQPMDVCEPASDKPIATKNEVGLSSATTAHTPEPSDASAFEIDGERNRTSSTTDVKRAQIGCLLIFTVSALLFVFLLFGLPYLLD
jgi:hypothetical protein